MMEKYFYPIVIAIVWLFASVYTFDRKADLNGDNFYYYLTASSMAEGHGYSSAWDPGCPPTSTYPPGYPILMTPLRAITPSIVAQKWMNEIFVLISLLLIYFSLIRLKFPRSLAFTAAVSGAVLPRLLHFSTMMMAEASFLLTAAIAFYILVRMQDDEKHKWRWILALVVCLVMNYHIRTQGIALVAAVALYFLLRGKWTSLIATLGGFAAGCLPWIIRNNVKGLSSTRYLDMVMMANPWRPEEGTLSIPEFVSRFFQTLKMLVFNAIPNCVIPFINVNPDNPQYGFWIYLAGAVILGLIIAGCIRSGKIGIMAGGFIAATLLVISSFSTPSGSRYITSILPFLAAFEIIGLWWALDSLLKLKWKRFAFPALLLLPLLLTSMSGLDYQHKVANARYPKEYQHFFEVSKALKKAPDTSVVCSRKPQMSYFHSGKTSCNYLFSSDTEAVIRKMISDNVDYVIIDALGFASTKLYLVPAILEYIDFFDVLIAKEETSTFLLLFKRADAAQQLSGKDGVLE